jgi:hypothetical protein
MTTGTITQTLSIPTQLATGQQLYLGREVAAAVVYAGPEIAPGIFGDTIFEPAIAADNIRIIEAELLSSTATASDTQATSSVTFLAETATAASALQAAETTLLVSTIRVRDTISQSITAPLVSSINATNSFVLSRNILLTESFTALENITPNVSYYQLVTAAITASDQLSTGESVLLESGATITGTLTPSTIVSEIISDVVVAIGSQVPQTTAKEFLSYTAVGSSTFAFNGSVYNEAITEIAQIGDWIWAKDFGSIAWVLNTQSGGLTNYDNYGFTSLAFHDGVLYGTSHEGLFAINADDDAGRDINALRKGGFLDFNRENKKRISDIYTGYTGGPLECEVETYDKEVYTYPMEFRDFETPHNSRIKPGRGLSSRYWRFGFRNVSGADFQIQDITVKLGMSKRRV